LEKIIGIKKSAGKVRKNNVSLFDALYILGTIVNLEI
jgi:hypothetical protein